MRPVQSKPGTTRSFCGNLRFIIRRFVSIVRPSALSSDCNAPTPQPCLHFRIHRTDNSIAFLNGPTSSPITSGVILSNLLPLCSPSLRHEVRSASPAHRLAFCALATTLFGARCAATSNAQKVCSALRFFLSQSAALAVHNNARFSRKACVSSFMGQGFRKCCLKSKKKPMRRC